MNRLFVHGRLILLAVLVAGSAAGDNPPPVEKALELNRKLMEHYEHGRLDQALKAAEQALAILRRHRAANDPDILRLQANMAMIAMQSGEFEKALKHQQQAIAAYEKSGKKDADLAIMYCNAGRIAMKLRRIDDAERAFSRSAQLSAKYLPQEHPLVAKIHGEMAGVYRARGALAKAVQSARKAAEMHEKIKGLLDPETLSLYNSLAVMIAGSGLFREADKVYRKAEKGYDMLFKEDYPAFVLLRQNMGRNLYKMGQDAAARAMLEKTLALNRKIRGTKNEYTIANLTILGSLYEDIGLGKESNLAYDEALRAAKQLYGEKHPQIAEIYNGRGTLCSSSGDWKQAVFWQRKALAIDVAYYGADHPESLIVSLNIAKNLGNADQFEDALAIYRSCRKSLAARPAKNHPVWPGLIRNESGLRFRMGDFKESTRLARKAVEVCEKVYGKQHTIVAEAYSALAVHLCRLARLEGEKSHRVTALAAAKRALAISRSSAGEMHPLTAGCYNNLAHVYVEMGDLVKGTAMYSQSYVIHEKTQGRDHPETLDTLNNLAFCMDKTGRHELAAKGYARALEAHNRLYGGTSIPTLRIRSNLALSYIVQGRIGEARQQTMTYLRDLNKAYQYVFRFAAESERLNYCRQLDPYHLPCSLGDAPLIARAVLRYKGAVLDTLMEERRLRQANGDPRNQALLSELNTQRRKAMQITLKGVGKDQLPAIQASINELEGRLTKNVGRYGQALKALSTDVADVQEAIPVGSALIEYICYGHHSKGEATPSIGAVVLRRDGTPIWVRLASQPDVKAAVKKCNDLIRKAKAGDAALQSTLRRLHRLIWAPLLPHLSKASEIIVSPDGCLNLVPFACILDDKNRFLCEGVRIDYVTSGRSLLKSRRRKGTGIQIFAAPDFGATGSGPDRPGEFTRDLKSGFANVSFKPLPGTRTEAVGIARLARDRRIKVALSTGRQASEENLSSLRSPAILHLATHGFFLDDVSSLTGRQQGAAPNAHSSKAAPTSSGLGAMYRSGIALSGAQASVDKWKKTSCMPGQNDGILFAYEVSMLKLDETQLVVLSACDTGVGEISAGEGVIGLKRGFAQAGAKQLLMTLWPVSDKETAKFMRTFYADFLKGVTPNRCLNSLQRQRLVELRKTEGLHRAVRIAGPFILSR